jgi:hypothetical protein
MVGHFHSSISRVAGLINGQRLLAAELRAAQKDVDQRYIGYCSEMEERSCAEIVNFTFIGGLAQNYSPWTLRTGRPPKILDNRQIQAHLAQI